MNILNSTSKEISDLLKALKLDGKLISSLTFTCEAGSLVVLEVRYMEFVWDPMSEIRSVVERRPISDLGPVTEFLKRYELHEIP